ncbi:hypothetical protein OIV83_004762 [Microbotryomycetes sp. JL201]|nr:hypothetical protein OIV83_004762 [Microbotryomycetes sp. JL201]
MSGPAHVSTAPFGVNVTSAPDLSTASGSRAPSAVAAPPKRRKKSSAAEGDQVASADIQTAQLNDSGHPEKKTKACHSCRRVKLRCVVENEGGPCKRCAARGEECVYTTPLHDLKWQQSMESRVEHLSDTVEYLVTVIGNIAGQLSIPFQPPQASPQAQIVQAVGPVGSWSPSAPPTTIHNNVNKSKRARSPSEEASTSSRRMPSAAPDYDYLTQSGAESLLLQGYARFSPPSALAALPNLSATASLLSPQQSSVPLPPQSRQPNLAVARTQQRDAQAAANSMFDLIDIVTGQQTSLSTDMSTEALQKSSTGINAADLEIVGSQDPRNDIVKSGAVSSTDAEVLLDFFHAQLAPHFNGFVLRMRAWPYLPAGKSTITPLVLASICLVAAERLPRFHQLLERLESSELNEPILNATPGLSFAPGSESTAENGLEPDLDPELGIGPEEISALLVYASFSSSPRSDTIARTAFEWARGYLKTFMLSSPRKITYGEVFGLLTAYRDLTFENWLRLWLIGYVVDVQQSLHRESLAPVFDPHYFCDTLLAQSDNMPNLIDQQHDRELVAHARLCALLQKVQYTRASPLWVASSTADSIIASADGWNSDLDRWWSEQDLTTSTVDMTLSMFKSFGRIFVNLPTFKEAALRDRAEKWRFKSVSANAAWELLTFVKDEPQAGNINLLFPFFIKARQVDSLGIKRLLTTKDGATQMVLLSAVIVLDSFQDSLFMIMPCTLEQAMTTINQVADNLSCAPVPAHHPCRSATVALRTALERAKDMVTRAHGSFLGSAR